MFDTDRGIESKIVDGNDLAVSPDGESMIYGTDAIYRVSLARPNDPKLVLKKYPAWPVDWSGDGRYVLIQHPEPATGFDVSVLDVRDGSLKPLLHSTAMEGRARFSPDGKWIAYVSNESGRGFDVHACQLPDCTNKAMVSNAGGAIPSWRNDGRELFYIGPDRMLTAVDVKSDGERLHFGQPRQLFTIRRPNSEPVGNMFGQSYAPSRSGDRFLVSQMVGDEPGVSIAVVVNWPEVLRRSVPPR